MHIHAVGTCEANSAAPAVVKVTSLRPASIFKRRGIPASRPAEICRPCSFARTAPENSSPLPTPSPRTAQRFPGLIDRAAPSADMESQSAADSDKRIACGVLSPASPDTSISTSTSTSTVTSTVTTVPPATTTYQTPSSTSTTTSTITSTSTSPSTITSTATITPVPLARTAAEPRQQDPAQFKGARKTALENDGIGYSGLAPGQKPLLNVHLDQDPAQQLSGGVAGKLLDEHHVAGHLVASQVVLDVLLDLRRVLRGTRLGHDEGA